MLPAAIALGSSQTLANNDTTREQQLQGIQTKTTFRNGRTLVNSGVGFVLGNLFFTVNHNLDPGYAVRHYSTQSYLDGIPVRAIAVDATNDLAVIRIPPALCATWCNKIELPDAARIGLQQQVEWRSNRTPNKQWQQANVLSITQRGENGQDAQRNTDCQNGLVVEITEPFLPGSSGTAVWDTQTQQLLGMVQGSYERTDGSSSGYFKPLACILEHLQKHGLGRSTQP